MAAAQCDEVLAQQSSRGGLVIFIVHTLVSPRWCCELPTCGQGAATGTQACTVVGTEASKQSGIVFFYQTNS